MNCDLCYVNYVVEITLISTTYLLYSSLTSATALYREISTLSFS